MRCPYCRTEDSRVMDSRELSGGETIRRRRECVGCHRRFTTYERVEAVSLVVVKKDGRREEFVRTNCARSSGWRSPNARSVKSRSTS